MNKASLTSRLQTKIKYDLQALGMELNSFTDYLMENLCYSINENIFELGEKYKRN